MIIEDIKKEKLQGLQRYVDNDSIGDLKKLNLFYNGNDDSKCLLFDFIRLLKIKGLKCVAYVCTPKGYRVPNITLYVVTKDYEKPKYQKDVDYIFKSVTFSNHKNVGINSEQYKIIYNLYMDILNL